MDETDHVLDIYTSEYVTLNGTGGTDGITQLELFIIFNC